MKRNRRLIEFTKKGSNFKTKFLKTKWPTKKKERNSESLEAMTQCFYKKKRIATVSLYKRRKTSKDEKKTNEGEREKERRTAVRIKKKKIKGIAKSSQKIKRTKKK